VVAPWTQTPRFRGHHILDYSRLGTARTSERTFLSRRGTEGSNPSPSSKESGANLLRCAHLHRRRVTVCRRYGSKRVPRQNQVRTRLTAGGRWVRTSGCWSRERQTVVEDGTAVSKTGTDLLGNRRSIHLPPAANHERTGLGEDESEIGKAISRRSSSPPCEARLAAGHSQSGTSSASGRAMRPPCAIGCRGY
jgi:hypothetical protein